MFRKINTLAVILSVFLLSSCFLQNGSGNKDEKTNNKVAIVSTKYGDMKILLYDETPLHQANFIKLAENGNYDSLIFHRVINKFMIQGGDTESKNAKPGATLGNGGPGYTIPAEIDTAFIHKKGALCAARQGDNVNPKKESSGSQFYFVQGQTYKDDQLVQMQERVNGQAKNNFLREYLNKPENTKEKQTLDAFQKNRDRDGLNAFIKELELKLKNKIDSVTSFRYSVKQKEIYKTIGGTPHLDGAYTVFGEVIEGLNVIDSIANVKTKKGDRPVEDVVFTVKILK